MSESMAISRSCEEKMYLLREGDCVWRVNENGKIDCTAKGPTPLFELLHFLQEWKIPPSRLFLNYPLTESPD